MIAEVAATELARIQVKLPASVAQAFWDLGDAQRGRPEIAMLNLCDFYSGVAAPMFEHCGDLTWRVSHWAKGGDMDLEVLNKVNKCLYWLSPTFADEVESNIKNNSAYRKIPEDEYRAKFIALREAYAKEHAQLVVYNKIQWHCREAAVNLGKWDLHRCKQHLQSLQEVGRNRDRFVREGYAYTLDPHGNPIPY